MMNPNMMLMNNMQNQFNSNEINIEEILKPFNDKIKKLQDEIIQKDTEIAQLKLKLKQYDNANKKYQQFMENNMGMNMMNNMGQMNNNNNMGQMNNKMNPMNNAGNQMNMNMNINNNPFNMMNLNLNNMMNNFLMKNQINNMENKKLPRIGMGYEDQDSIKYLSIKVKMEEGYLYQCNANLMIK